MSYPPSLDLSSQKVTKMETKARKGQVSGMRLTTDKGAVWTLNGGYDDIKDATVVAEETPGEGWALKGFYGAATTDCVVRIGPIWGRREVSPVSFY